MNFDDADFLNNSISHRIKKIDFYHDGKGEIFGFKAYYVMYKHKIEWEEKVGFANIDHSLLETAKIQSLEIE